MFLLRRTFPRCSAFLWLWKSTGVFTMLGRDK
jgi:hypothetical protein